MNKVTRKYLRQVRTLLPLSRSKKREQTEGLRCSLEAYAARHPGADYAAVCADFGGAEEFAASCVENMPTGDLLRKLRYRQTVLRILAAALFLAAVSWGAAVSTAIHVARQDRLHTIVVTVEEKEMDDSSTSGG